jgi:hypothetical protein
MSSVTTDFKTTSDKQNRFIEALGFTANASASTAEASQFITQILRPIDDALNQVLKQHQALPREILRPIQVALARSAFYHTLPRHGPYITATEYRRQHGDVDTQITREKREEILRLIKATITPEQFTRLETAGLAGYKKKLTAT